MTLLERESGLASLAEYAQDARTGAGRLVLVAGEAGVGKSALVEELWRRETAPDHSRPPVRWAWGSCDGLFTPRPLGPLFDIAEQLGGELLELCRAGAGRDALFDALLRQLGEAGAPHVVVIEDVHWADEATIDLLRFLGRRLRHRPVLVIATYRDEGLTASDPLRLALGELATQRSTRRVWLAPLSVEAVGELAADSGLEAAELHRLTGGNPFYVTEVVHAGSAQVPASALDAVLARAARLGDAARHVLAAAALIGARLEPRLLAAASDATPADIDELLASGLLVAEGTGLRFRHEIARLAVEQGIAAHRRVLIHGRILTALRALGSDDDARMAFHAQEADDAGAAHEHALRAGQRAAALGAHREAVVQYERALRWAPALAPAALAELYEAYAAEASLVDRWLDAARALEAALPLWRKVGDQVREGSALRKLSRPMWRLCRGADALATAQAALATLEPAGPSAELAWAYANVANQRDLLGEHTVATELTARAVAIADRLDVPGVVSDALNTRACATAALGGDWQPGLSQALAIALDGGQIAQAGRAYTNLYYQLNVDRRFAEAQRLFDEALGFCAEHDLDTYVTCLRGELTSLLTRRGRWSEAAALATELLGLGASPINRLNPLISLGTVRARRGEEGGWERLDEAAHRADGCGEPQWIAPARLARAEAAWLEGRDRAARAEAEAAAAVVGTCDSWQRGATATWLIRLGVPGPVTMAAALARPVAEPYRLQLDGDGRAAAACWLELGSPYEAALALFDAGGEDELREALTLVDDLGAAATGRLIRRTMRRRGIRSIPAGARTQTRSHPFGLTRRESEVLSLLGTGRTNAEIAAALVISAKTVDHHVSAVLAKLEAPTRAVAAAKARRLGLLDPSR